MAVQKIDNLNIHENPATNQNEFDIENYMNANWNEIKEVVNNNADELSEVQENISDIQEEQETQNTKISTLETDNTTNKKDISDLKEENETQETSIEELQENLENTKNELSDAQQEIDALKTIQNALPTIDGEGESLTLKGTAENTTFKKFQICGNSEQETRNGYNKFNAKLFSNQTQAGATQTIQEDGTISITGTGKTTDNYNGSASNTRVPLSLKVGNLHIKIDKQSRPAIYLALRNSDDELIGNTVTNFQGSVDTTINITQELIDAGIFLHQYIYTEKDITIIPNDVKVMLYQDGDGTYEAYGAMPSPDYPSKVEAVGDDVQLFDKDNSTIEVGSINSSGILVDSSVGSRIRVYDINLEENKTYTVSVSDKNLNIVPYFYNEEGTFVSYLSGWKSMPYTFTMPEGTSILKLLFKNVSDNEITVDNVANANLKIQEGETATKWSTYGTGSASTTVCNKNLFDKNNYVTIIQGQFLPTRGFNNDNRHKTVLIECKGNLELSAYIKDRTNYNGGALACFSEMPNPGVTKPTKVSNSPNALNITTDAETRYLAIYLGATFHENWTSTQDAIDSIILVEGTADLTSKDYVEHQEQNFTMPCQKEMLEEDYFDLDTFEEVHACGKIIVDGVDNKFNSSNASGSGRWFRYNGGFWDETSATSTTDMKSTHFKISNSWEGNTSYGKYTSHGFSVQVMMKDATLTSVNDGNNWAKSENEAGRPLTFYYKLQEKERLPMTTEQIAVAKQIKNTLISYKDTTHVYSEDELSPIFKCSAIADISNILTQQNQVLVERS